MAAHSFHDLARHYGHTIEVVIYGSSDPESALNVAVECQDCNEIIMDFDRYNEDPDQDLDGETNGKKNTNKIKDKKL